MGAMTEIREVLARHGFGFKKQYGQNFLTDVNLLRAIVGDAGVDGTAAVLEIGAGAGALTRALAERAKRVVSFEIDRSLRPVLEETLAGVQNVELVFGDFARCDLAALEERLGRYFVVANLPYYITTPIVMRFVEHARLCAGMCVMVQEEVAARFAARPGTPDYGAVTAAIALRGRCEIVRKVPRTMFFPRPNVDSAVVRIVFEEDRLPVLSQSAYRAVVRAAFSARRKTLENDLMSAFSLPRASARELLLAAGIAEGVRGETLPPESFARLADELVRNKILS